MNYQIFYLFLDRTLPIVITQSCTSKYISYQLFSFCIKNTVKCFSLSLSSFKFFYLFFLTFISIIRNDIFIFNIGAFIKALFLTPTKRVLYTISSHALSNTKGYTPELYLVRYQLKRFLKDRILLLNTTKTGMTVFPY